MENYSYNSYPESGGSSPRSREIDFENPTPWEDQPAGNNNNNNNNNSNSNSNNYKVKLMCSYGGKIHPRPHDNQLSYIGGETKILSVDRSIKFSVLIAKLAALCDVDVSFKYQLPGEDLDALISVTNDDDLDHMMNEYDRLNRASPKPARLRLFLFPVIVQTPVITPVNSFGSTEGRSERERFVDALNSAPIQTSAPSPPLPTHGNADFLFGSEKVAVQAPLPNLPVPKVPDLPAMDPPVRHHEPDVAVLDERAIGADRIQKHIQDLRRLRIAEDQQQNMYRQSDDNLAGGYSGDYYVQRTAEKVVSTTLPGNVPGYQISGGYTPSTISTDQQPVYMVPTQSNMYHAPMARPVTGPIGHSQGQGPSQGYYAVQRIPAEVYRDQPVYNGMQPMVTQQPIFPPQQPPPAQKAPTHSEGIRVIQSTAGMADPGYTQVAYDNSLGRHVYYTAQGAMVTPPPQQPHQVQLQQTPHQYQPVAAASTAPTGPNQIQDGKRSEKLSELLKISEMLEEEEEEVKRKVRLLEELKRVAKRLQCGGNDDVLIGAKEVRRLAKDDSDARTTLALLGAIPPLIALLDSGDLDSQIAGLYAVLNIGIGNDTNKAAIVKAGAVHKMLDLIKSPNEGSPDRDLRSAIVANFLGLTALDSNKPIIGSSGAVLFLVKTLMSSVESEVNSQVIQDCLRALYNLSILPSNVSPMIEIDGFVPFLLTALGDMEVSDRILSLLSNVVSTPEGRKAVSGVRDSFQILVDVLSWTDSPDCQEKATYILMVMAHKSYRDRQVMIESGVTSTLLELTLLGSTLAQKRASRILDILRIDKGKQVSETFVCSTGANVSAPQCGSVDSRLVNSTDPLKDSEDDTMMSDESKAVKNLVQQSLHSNMRRMAKRANLPQDFVPSEHFRSLTSISTSKSLPF